MSQTPLGKSLKLNGRTQLGFGLSWVSFRAFAIQNSSFQWVSDNFQFHQCFHWYLLLNPKCVTADKSCLYLEAVCDLLSPCLIMRAAVLLTIVAVATGAPKFSKKALSTPLSRGGGRIVGGTEAYAGEFPHQIALLRGGVGGSLMCGGSLVKDNMVVTAGHCCDG